MRNWAIYYTSWLLNLLNTTLHYNTSTESSHHIFLELDFHYASSKRQLNRAFWTKNSKVSHNNKLWLVLWYFGAVYGTPGFQKWDFHFDHLKRIRKLDRSVYGIKYRLSDLGVSYPNFEKSSLRGSSDVHKCLWETKSAIDIAYRWGHFDLRLQI